jgi:tetratricopeptide (TPR) repeat protein
MSARTKDLLTLTMIVKDEATNLAATLASIKPFIDRWVIADTGSTDGTPEVVRKAMEGVPGELVDIPFVNFADTRNAGLEACGEHTEFILWLDAEDVLHGGEALRRFLEREHKHRGPDREAYYLRVDAGFAWNSPRILRSRARWRFRGVVHEILTHEARVAPTIRVPDVVIAHNRAEHSVERTRRRWERDRQLLQDELAKNPTDTRATFYLAQTHACLGQLEPAITVYQQRIALGGWREEIYESKFQVALLSEQAGRPWPEVLALYLDAHAFAPHRAEPLYQIALHHNLRGEHPLAVLYARRGLDLPFPEQDQLFVLEEIYRWKLADLMGASAFWIGEFEMGEAAARKALRARPDDVRLQKNLAFYLERKKKPKRR